MISIIDYGMGNLRSIQNALSFVGASHRLTRDPEELLHAAKLILPGVGSFRKAMDNLTSSGMGESIIAAANRGTPILGICLGMQLLADEGEEGGVCNGLGLIGGKIAQFESGSDEQRVPHMGFNEVRFVRKLPIFAGIAESSHFYFAHSYHLVGNNEDVAGITTHGMSFVSIVARENVIGTQFHPEKSQSHGLQLLRNFCNGSIC